VFFFNILYATGYYEDYEIGALVH